MKISVITISYNAEATIAETIDSVLSQTYDDVEYIIIDGASTDGTIGIINLYKEKIDHFITEPDAGVYNAMNKGLALANGDLIAILNADDVYANSTVLSKVANALKLSGDRTCYGDLQYVSRAQPDKITRIWKSGAFKRKNFEYGWMPPHPAFFVKKELYDALGYFDIRLKTSADYELMLRFLYRHGFDATYIPEVLVKMKTGGQSNASLKNRIQANREDRLAWKLNGLKPKPFTTLLKPARKLTQFFGR